MDSWSEYEIVACIGEEIMSATHNPMNIHDPKMRGPDILDELPLRVVPSVAFDKEKLGLSQK